MKKPPDEADVFAQLLKEVMRSVQRAAAFGVGQFGTSAVIMLAGTLEGLAAVFRTVQDEGHPPTQEASERLAARCHAAYDAVQVQTLRELDASCREYHEAESPGPKPPAN